MSYLPLLKEAQLQRDQSSLGPMPYALPEVFQQ
jgi:hypothetical protein